MSSKFDVIYDKQNIRELDPERSEDAEQLQAVAGGMMSIGLNGPISIAVGFITICGGVTISGCMEF